MADDNRILQMVLEVKDQDVVKATTNVAALESRIKKLVKAEQDGKYTDAQFAAGKQQITNSLSNMANVSKNKAERAVRSLINTERALTREVKVNTVALSSNAKASQNASAAMNQYGTVSGLAGKKLNTFNMKIQQGGYQLQDFAVQMQGGTSFFTAFAQQGSQFAGVFGPTGAVVGAVIAIGSAIAGVALSSIKASEGVMKFSDAISAAEGHLSDYNDAVERMQDEDLADTFGRYAEQVIKMDEATKGLSLSLASLNIAGGFKGLTAEVDTQFSVFEGFLRGLGNTIDAFNSVITLGIMEPRLAAVLAPTGAEKLRSFGVNKSDQGLGQGGMANEITNIQAAMSSGQFEEAHNRILYLIEHINASGDKLNIEGQTFLLSMRDAAKFGLELAGNLDGSTEALKESRAQEKAAAEAEIKYSEYMAKFVEDYEKNKLKLARAGVETQIALGNRLQDEAEKRAAEEFKNYFDAKKTTLQKQIDLENKFQSDSEKRAAAGVANFIKSEEEKLNVTRDALQQHIDLDNRLEAEAADRAVAFVEDWKKAFDTVVHLSGLAAENMMKYAGRGTTSSKEVAFGDDRDKTPPKDKTLSGTTLDIIEAEAKARMAALLLGDEELALYERQLDIRQTLGDYSAQYSDATVRAAAERIEAMQTEEDAIERIRQRNEALAETIAQTMGDGLMSIVDGTKSVEQAFKDMARLIIVELYKVLVVEQMVLAIKNAIRASGYLPFENGSAFSGGNVVPFASGGVVGSPTTFPMSGGRTGLMGEAGPEAIMPLQRGANGKLGVAVNGGESGTTVNQVINISTGVQQTVRNEIRSMMPQIAEASKAAVVDSKRRGGSYGGSFR
jgi:hypothetical protein